MRGAVNPLSVLFIAAAVGALYFVIMFGPVYIDNMSVSEAADIGVHLSKTDDEHITTAVLNRLNMGSEAVGGHFEDDPETGERVEKKGLGLTADNVTITRDEAAKTIHVAIDYAREVRLKPTQTWRNMSFHVEKEGPISQ